MINELTSLIAVRGQCGCIMMRFTMQCSTAKERNTQIINKEINDVSPVSHFSKQSEETVLF